MSNLGMGRTEVERSAGLSLFREKKRYTCRSHDCQLTVTWPQILVTTNDSRLRLYNLKDHSLSCKYKGGLNTSSQIRATFRSSKNTHPQNLHPKFFISIFSCSRDGLSIVCGSEDHFIYVWKTHHDVNKLSSVRRDRNEFYESFTSKTCVSQRTLIKTLSGDCFLTLSSPRSGNGSSLCPRPGDNCGSRTERSRTNDNCSRLSGRNQSLCQFWKFVIINLCLCNKICGIVCVSVIKNMWVNVGVSAL